MIGDHGDSAVRAYHVAAAVCSMLCTVLFTMLEHVTGLQGSDLAQNAHFEAKALRLPQAK